MKKRLILVTFLLFAVVLLAGCSTISASSWPGVTYDSNTDAVYVAYNSFVISVDPNTGTEKWRFPAEAEGSITFFAPPAVTSDGQVIAGGYDQNLYSIDAQSGAQNWVFEGASNRYIATPLVIEDKIFAPNADDHLYALTTQNVAIWQTPFQATQPLWGTPGIDSSGETLFLTSMDRNVYAVDAQTGVMEWSKPMEGASVGSTTVSGNGDVFVGNFANQLLSLNAEDGSSGWSLVTSGWVWSGPLLQEDLLFFGDLEGTFYAVNRDSGSVAWQIQPDGQVVGQPAVAGDRIFFGTESGTLYVVDLRGNIIRSVDAGGSIYSAPVTTDDLVIVAPYQNDQLLVAYDFDGNLVWSFTPGNQ
jgi:eukaryotic-like serine/threonine-protein kinase